MKKRTRTAITVVGVLVAVGFAGFLAYSAHGRFEGLINGSDDQPVVTPPAGLTPGSGTGGNPQQTSIQPAPNAAQSNGTTSTALPALTPSTGQSSVDIGLRQHRGEGGEGGRE